MASLKNHSPQVNRTSITPKRAENRPSCAEQQDDVSNKKNRNRAELMYEEEDDEPNEKLDKIILKEKERLEREKNERKNAEKKRHGTKNGSPAQETNKNKFNDSDNKDPAALAASTSEMSKNDLSKLSISDESDRSATSTSKRNSSPIIVPPVKRMKQTKERTYKPFHKLLEGVVLVISGIQVCVDTLPYTHTIFFLFKPQSMFNVSASS